jgi:pSer/pThr/pTyr-binding forkhead associated (FHA) protein
MSLGPAHSPRELAARLEAERRAPAFLVFRDADGEQHIVDLDPAASASITLGRQAVCDVPLTWDPEASRVHARVECIGSEWTLSDQGSRNGTYVNGVRLQGPRRLQSGDVVRIGRTAVMFWSDGAEDNGATVTATGGRQAALSPAQRRVLVELCRPFAVSAYPTPATNGDIARALTIEVETVRTHMRALFDVFAIADLPQNRKRAELARVALESGAVTRRELVPDHP